MFGYPQPGFVAMPGMGGMGGMCFMPMFSPLDPRLFMQSSLPGNVFGQSLLASGMLSNAAAAASAESGSQAGGCCIYCFIDWQHH